MKPSQKKTGDPELGARIAAYRERAGLSRKELAAAIGVTYASIAQMETGYRMPTARNQTIIAKVLGVSLDELFGDAEQESFDAGAPLSVGNAPIADTSFAAARAVFPTGPVSRETLHANALQAKLSGAVSDRNLPEDLVPSRPDSSHQVPYGSMPDQPAPSHPASSRQTPPRPMPSTPSFDDSVNAALAALRSVPQVKRLDALIEVQQKLMRELAATAPPRAGWITKLAPDEVFVFGASDRAGHSSGAARTALERFGAKVGFTGYVGQSYGIVTMEGWDRLVDEVEAFLDFATRHPELRFLLTPIGTGTAGYPADQIAPLFSGAPDNVELPAEFQSRYSS